jgi:pimeloyl-ACP methyl ester carboxylesterase
MMAKTGANADRYRPCDTVIPHQAMTPAITICIIVLAIMALLATASLVARTAVLGWLQRRSSVVETRRGPIECAVVGSGPPVMILHGGMGGWDQAIWIGATLLGPEPTLEYRAAIARGDDLMKGRCALICPTRVGYLRTPLSAGRTPGECADALASLLDALDVERAVVMGISGGGPTALQFAIRHPGRTAALVMVAAIARRHVQPTRTTESFAGRIVFARGFGWFLDLLYGAGLTYARLFPWSAARRMLRATETFDEAGIDRRVQTLRARPEQIRWLHGLLESGYPLSARKVGLTNDLEQFEAIEDYNLRQIISPTLVVHGRHDGNVPFEHAEFVARGVNGAELVVAETCGHLLWMSDEAQGLCGSVQAFVRTHASEDQGAGCCTPGVLGSQSHVERGRKV